MQAGAWPPNRVPQTEGFKRQKYTDSGSGGQKSKVKVWAVLGPPEG